MPKVPEPKTAPDTEGELDPITLHLLMIDEIGARLELLRDLVEGNEVEVDFADLFSLTKPDFEVEAPEKKPEAKPKKKVEEEEQEETETETETETEQEEVETEQEGGEEDEFDPEPFNEAAMDVARKLAKAQKVTDKKLPEGVSEYIEFYCENAPADAPATKAIKKLIKAGKLAEAYIHMLSLVVDDEGEAHEWDDAVVRNNHLYIGGTNSLTVPASNFSSIEAGDRVFVISKGTFTKASKKHKEAFETPDEVHYFPVAQTYLSVLDEDTMIEVLCEEKA